MILKLGGNLQQDQLIKFEFLTNYSGYRIYWTNDEESNFFALDKNNVICALFEFVDDVEFIQLAHMHVLEHHRGKGIGKEIMRQAVKIYPSFNLPSKDTTQKYYYIENGLRFIRRCFKDGILSSTAFVHPDEDDFVNFS
jgi:GNAT superfamily N-acetyltransferase